MAIKACSESSSLCTSPRISFSHNLLHPDDSAPIESTPFRLDSSLLDPNYDFNFWVGDETSPSSSSADELFSDGVIRPIQIQQRVFPPKQSTNSPVSVPPISDEIPKEEETVAAEGFPISETNLDYTEQRSQSKSFWRFKRSSSLHCENTQRKSSFWSLPLLLRSNSTGSVPNQKRSAPFSSSSKDCQKQNLSKPKSSSSSSSSSSSGVHNHRYPPSSSSSSQRPPLQRSSYGGWYGNGGGGVRISPVLNVPPPYISKGTANLFGLGSLLRHGRDSKKMKERFVV